MFKFYKIKNNSKIKLPEEFTVNIIKTSLFGLDREYRIGDIVLPDIIKDSQWEFPNVYIDLKKIFKMRKYIIHHLKYVKDSKIDKLVKALEDIWKSE